MQKEIFVPLILIGSYLLGSIPFGVIISKLYRVDITKVGSKNIGTTNVLRAVGVLPAVMVFACDFFKGAIPICVTSYVGFKPAGIVLAGFLAILGHAFPVFLKFRGGKGVATTLGVLFALAPEVFLFIIILYAIIAAFTRYVSLSSIVTSLAAVVAMWFFGRPVEYVVLTALVSILIIYKHVPNIQRLVTGEERKIGEKI